MSSAVQIETDANEAGPQISNSAAARPISARNQLAGQAFKLGMKREASAHLASTIAPPPENPSATIRTQAFKVGMARATTAEPPESPAQEISNNDSNLGKRRNAPEPAKIKEAPPELSTFDKSSPVGVGDIGKSAEVVKPCCRPSSQDGLSRPRITPNLMADGEKAAIGVQDGPIGVSEIGHKSDTIKPCCLPKDATAIGLKPSESEQIDKSFKSPDFKVYESSSLIQIGASKLGIQPTDTFAAGAMNSAAHSAHRQAIEVSFASIAEGNLRDTHLSHTMINSFASKPTEIISNEPSIAFKPNLFEQTIQSPGTLPAQSNSYISDSKPETNTRTGATSVQNEVQFTIAQPLATTPFSVQQHHFSSSANSSQLMQQSSVSARSWISTAIATDAPNSIATHYYAVREKMVPGNTARFVKNPPEAIETLHPITEKLSRTHVDYRSIKQEQNRSVVHNAERLVKRVQNAWTAIRERVVEVAKSLRPERRATLSPERLHRPMVERAINYAQSLNNIHLLRRLNLLVESLTNKRVQTQQILGIISRLQQDQKFARQLINSLLRTSARSSTAGNLVKGLLKLARLLPKAERRDAVGVIARNISSKELASLVQALRNYTLTARVQAMIRRLASRNPRIDWSARLAERMSRRNVTWMQQLEAQLLSLQKSEQELTTTESGTDELLPRNTRKSRLNARQLRATLRRKRRILAGAGLQVSATPEHRAKSGGNPRAPTSTRKGGVQLKTAARSPALTATQQPSKTLDIAQSKPDDGGQNSYYDGIL